ncbi:MAG: hypothetical protein ACYCV5_02495 [Acidimicrobiales bacterium]|jgi:hypothetical protein
MIATMVIGGLLAAGCGGGAAVTGRHRSTSPAAVAPKTVAPTTTTVPRAPQTTPSTTPSTQPVTPSTPTFPALVVQAMSQFNPLPAGAEAPERLPGVPGYLTAQTGGLGGQDNVTLIATTQPVAVNSPSLSTSAAGTEIASFSTTPTASTANASAALAQARSQSIDTCAGPSQTVSVAGGITATSCPTVDGAALTWNQGTWIVQVVTLSGTTPSSAEAASVAGDIASFGLPSGAADGMVGVVVPGNPSAGAADTAVLEWTKGADVYEVRSSDNPPAAITLAAAMRPYAG